MGSSDSAIRDRVGPLVAVGRTSNVHAFGSGSVIKIPHPGVPIEWSVYEAELSDAVHRAGLPAPAVHDVVELDGRPVVVFERVEGPSMWQQMLDHPGELETLAGELVSIHRLLLSGGIPAGVPDFVDRLSRRIRSAELLLGAERDEAVSMAKSLPRGAALLHGDLHPGNVLMGPAGPVVIDWFDVSIGHPVADIIRSSILIRPGVSDTPDHLLGATRAMLQRLHQVYVNDFALELGAVGAELGRWHAVVAAGRLAEGAEVDDERLVQMWNLRYSTSGLELLSDG